MNFLNPGFLGLFALALPLIALYILKLRRRDVPVSSTLLWKQAVQDAQANHPFQRLRANLLLLLQLLLLALLVLALSRPAWKTQTSPGSIVVIVIDTSASMGAKEGTGTRLEKAKKAALTMIDSLEDSDEAMVVEGWSAARVVTGMTRDRAAVEAAVEGLSVRDTETSLDEALLLAATTVEKRAGAAVMLFSDGAGVRVPVHPVLEKQLTWVKCGEAADNAGITAFRAEPVLEADGRVQSRKSGGRTEYGYSVFAGISNFSGSRKKLYAALKAEGAVVAVRAVELGPGETTGVSFEVMLPGETPVEVSLDEADALAADNRAVTRLPEPGEVKVGFTGENKFVKAFLRTRPRVAFVEEAPDLWFCEGPAGDPPAGAHAVWFRPDRPVAGITPSAEADRAKALSWDETHGLLRFARFGDVHVGAAVKLSLPADGLSLVQGTAGPLIALVNERGRLRIAIAFRATDSDWPLRPSFPIFLSNLLRVVSETRASETPPQVPTGRPARFAVGSAPSARVLDPAGESHELPAEAGEVLFADTHRAGLHTIEAGGVTRPFGVNLLSEAESNLTPGENLASDKTKIEPVKAPGQENRDIWPWLAGLAMAFFLVEWLCFHRRLA